MSDLKFPFWYGSTGSGSETSNNNDTNHSATNVWTNGWIIVGVIFGFFLLLIPTVVIIVRALIKRKRSKLLQRLDLENLQSNGILNVNRPQIEDEPDFVPTYSKYPNENFDLGYYDERGEFHFNREHDIDLKKTSLSRYITNNSDDRTLTESLRAPCPAQIRVDSTDNNISTNTNNTNINTSTTNTQNDNNKLSEK